MGWQDRDYAKWTAAERRQFVGSAGAAAAAGRATPTKGSAGRRFRRSVLLAVVTAGALLLLGQFPRNHPVVPRLHVTLPSFMRGAASPTPSATTPERGVTAPTATRRRVRLLKAPRFAGVNTVLSLRGHVPTPGTVTVKGSYGGVHWTTLATVKAKSGSYTTRIHLSRRGQLHLRVVFPDGSRAVGSIHVG